MLESRLKAWLLTGAALIGGLAIGYWLGYDHGFEKAAPAGEESEQISSYEECAAAGYPIMESYPEQCAVPGGKTFVRELAEEKQSRFCPADAKECPDGSYVGRTGPNCEFAPCPGE